MTVRAITDTSVDLPVGGVWTIAVLVTDADRCPVDDAPVVTVTLPAGSTATPTVEHVSTGLYRVAYVVGTPDRYIARAVTTGHGAADFTAFVTATVAGTAMPDVDACRDYDKDNGGYASWTDGQVQDALDAEASAQRRVCKVPAAYPPDLRQALLRRVQRNIVMRGQPGVRVTENGDPVYTPTNDPEVRRFERPYRRLVFG